MFLFPQSCLFVVSSRTLHIAASVLNFNLRFDGLQDKIHDVFTTSTNSAILSSASIIFRIAMEDSSNAPEAPPKGSMASLSTVDEDNMGPSKQLTALEELNMQGLANTFQFLPANRGHVKKILNWFPELITKIIE